MSKYSTGQTSLLMLKLQRRDPLKRVGATCRRPGFILTGFCIRFTMSQMDSRREMSTHSCKCTRAHAGMCMNVKGSTIPMSAPGTCRRLSARLFS